MSYFTKVAYEDSGSLDAFSRLRVSEPEMLFSVQSQYNANPLEMEAGNTGTGVLPVHNASTRMILLSGTAGTGTSFLQSYQYSPYEPGRSQFIAITGLLGAGVAGWTKDFGYFDANNGVIFRQNGATNLQLILRTSTSGVVSDANIVNQSAWNIDTLGAGTLNPSGKTLDVTKVFILIIDLQFLGMGRVRVGFDIDGVIYYVHQFLNANNLTVPYMQSATLPISVLLTGTTTAAPASCYFKCASVQSEGGSLQAYGLKFSTPEVVVTAGNNTRTPIIAIRPKTTFNSIINRALFLLEDINLFVTGNASVYWELVLGGTYSGQVWADVNTIHSAFEYTSTPGTYTNLTGGLVIASGHAPGTGGGNNSPSIPASTLQSMHYPIALDRAGAVRSMGTLTLLVTGIGATSASRANLNYREIR